MLTPRIDPKELQKMLSVVATPAQAARILAVLSRDPGRTQLIASMKIWQGKLLTKMEGLKQIGWANDPAVSKQSVLVERATGYYVDGIDGVRIWRNIEAIHPSVAFPWPKFMAALGSATFENTIPFMYLDNKGNVTAGIGHLIENAQAARDLHNGGILSFRHKGGGARATDAEVTAEFNAVRKAAGKNFKATTFRSLTSLELALPEVLKLADKDARDHLRDALSLKDYAKFDRFPAIAQQAIADMAFSLGKPRFTLFINFGKAVSHRDWNTAAAESHRIGVHPDRNKKIHTMLIAAAAEDLAKNHFFISTDPKIAGFRKIVTLSTTNVSTLKIAK